VSFSINSFNNKIDCSLSEKFNLAALFILEFIVAIIGSPSANSSLIFFLVVAVALSFSKKKSSKETPFFSLNFLENFKK
jgi:hypothetical protein